MKIGICDYGIGGVSLYKALREKWNVDIVYISDSGYTPYGKVPEDQLRGRVSALIQYFRTLGVDYIAVACNAASTVLPQDDRVTGVIEHGVRLVKSMNPTGAVAIAGGGRTIESGVYAHLLAEEGIASSGIVAQELSIRIEAGDIQSDEMRSTIENIFRPVAGVTHLLLACTHYPVVTDQIQACLPGTHILDPMPTMCEWIEHHWPTLEGGATTQWLTTGDTEKMRLASKRAFGVEIDSISHITF